jgi:glycosyltransferase involved in cell wall biosynthesis
MINTTVIVPVYNRAKTLKATLNSLREQVYKDFEIIIIDDFSKDHIKLKNLLLEYQDLDIRYIRHSSNMHGGAARNTGIINAKGMYIAFLDSDDFWHKDKLKICLEKKIEENEIIYSKIMDRGIIRPMKPYDSKNLIDDYLLVENGTMQTSSLFMHRSFANKIMFDPILKRFQDFDFIIRASKIFDANFVFVDKILVEMGSDDKGNRISSSTDHIPALYWLTKVSPMLSEKSKAVFAFNRLINYASNNVSRRETLSFFIQFKCYLFIPYLDYKVVIKMFVGKSQRFIRR